MNLISTTKKEWIDELKKNSSLFKLEERNLIQSYLKDDYHLMKIYNNLMKEEIEVEKKLFEEFLKQIKLSIGDLYTYFRGAEKVGINKVRNFDIRDKIYKIEECLKKNKAEFKNKFELLLNEEEILEKELQEFQEGKLHSIERDDKDVNSNFDNKNNIFFSNIINEMSKEKTSQNNRPYLSIKSDEVMVKLEEYINYILTESNMFFEKFTEDDVIKIVQKLSQKDLDKIRIKINFIDSIIEKNLGGVNITWQARDHQDFLKLKAAHNNKIHTYEFLNELENILPFIPRSELKNHIKQYSKYLQFIELKKQLINRFKEIKSEIDSIEKNEILQKISNEKKSNPIIPKVDKEFIEQWKLKKLQKKKEKFEAEMKLNAEREEKEKEKFLKKANENKEMIENYKRTKSITEITNHSNKKHPHNEINEIDIQRIKEKNEKLVKKKMLLVKSKSINKMKNSENYTKYKLKKMEKFEKIESKLNQYTTGYEIKKRSKFDPEKDSRRDAATMANNVLNHFSRAVPQWRKGLL